MLKSHIDDLEANHEGYTTMITVASDKVDHVQLETSTSNKITSFKDTISSLKTNPPTSSPQPPSSLTNVLIPSATPPPHLSTPTLPPTSLALPWRCAFLLRVVGSASPGFFVTYAIKGDNWYDLMGGASATTS